MKIYIYITCTWWRNVTENVFGKYICIGRITRVFAGLLYRGINTGHRSVHIYNNIIVRVSRLVHNRVPLLCVRVSMSGRAGMQDVSHEYWVAITMYTEVMVHDGLPLYRSSGRNRRYRGRGVVADHDELVYHHHTASASASSFASAVARRRRPVHY